MKAKELIDSVLEGKEAVKAISGKINEDSSGIIFDILGIDLKEWHDFLNRLEDIDTQSFDLAIDISDYFRKRFELTDREFDAISRLRWSINNIIKGTPGAIRNNIFKAANSLEMKLPSGMF